MKKAFERVRVLECELRRNSDLMEEIMQYRGKSLFVNLLTPPRSYHCHRYHTCLPPPSSPLSHAYQVSSLLHASNLGRRRRFDVLCSSDNIAAPLHPPRLHPAEDFIEKGIFSCRFFTLMAVGGSLAGSLLCFFKGCTFVKQSFVEYFNACWHGVGSGNVTLLLVEALDVYLMGTVMLIFGMGIYELFISSIDVSDEKSSKYASRITRSGSNLFGLFRLQKSPVWLEIHSLEELKTKLGHVIVMILLVGLFEKSKKVHIHSGAELLFLAATVFLSAGCLFLLSKLHPSK